MLHPRQRGRIVVELGARGGDVDVEGLAGRAQPGRRLSQDGRREQHHGGLELAVGAHPSAQLGGQAGGELDAVALDGDVDVGVGLLQQQVADETTHEVYAGEILGERRAGPEEPPEEGVLGQSSAMV